MDMIITNANVKSKFNYICTFIFQGYSAILLQAVNDICPKMRCNILFFKGTPLISRLVFCLFKII